MCKTFSRSMTLNVLFNTSKGCHFDTTHIDELVGVKMLNTSSISEGSYLPEAKNRPYIRFLFRKFTSTYLPLGIRRSTKLSNTVFFCIAQNLP